jgi:hypothetical protein
MKPIITVPVVFALTIIATHVLTYHAAAKPRVAISQAESCIGLGCWPLDWPMRDAPERRESLQPVL